MSGQHDGEDAERAAAIRDWARPASDDRVALRSGLRGVACGAGAGP